MSVRVPVRTGGDDRKGGDMQPFECTGQWWLPNDDAHGVAGTLKVSQGGALRLWLVGALGEVSPFRSKAHPVILGWVDKSPAGDIVTLRDCPVGGSTVRPGRTTLENYHATTAFFGAHLSRPGDFAFKSMTLRLSGLSEWAHGYTGLSEGLFPAVAATYEQKGPFVAEVSGGRLTLSVGIASHQTDRERIFRETVSLGVSCDAVKSADDLNGDFVYPLQNLMTFVSDRAQEVEHFAVRAGEPPTNAMGPDIRVIGPRVQPEDEGAPPEPVGYFQMLFTLKDVDFPSFAGKWLSVSNKFADACSVFFGLQYGPPAFIDMAFPSVVQALHLYYTRRDDGAAARAEEGRLRGFLSSLPAGDAEWIADRLEGSLSPPLKVVLSKLVEEHPHVMNRLVSNRQDRFVGSVINTLRYIQTRDQEVYGAASHGADLYWTMQKLRFLYKACLLRELGFSDDKAAALFDRNGLYHHVCELEAAEEVRRQQS
jgi:hypothetical protein